MELGLLDATCESHEVAASSDDSRKGIKGKKVKGIIDVKVLVLDWY